MRRVLPVMLAVALLGACGEDGQDDYTLETEQRFIRECAESADRQACRCIYLRIVESMPYERFVELDAARAADPSFLPPELEEYALDCAFGLAE